MAKTITTRYDVAEHLRTPEEMAAYLEACLEESNGDAALARHVVRVGKSQASPKPGRRGISAQTLYDPENGENRAE